MNMVFNPLLQTPRRAKFFGLAMLVGILALALSAIANRPSAQSAVKESGFVVVEINGIKKTPTPATSTPEPIR